MKKNRILKLFLSFVLFVACTVSGFAQQGNVTIDAKNETLKSILVKIEGQTDYKFLYNTKLVNVEQTVTVKCDNVPLATALNKIFSGKSISWKIADRQIVLSHEDAAVNASQSSSNDKNVITGVVVDEDGITMPGVVIKVKNSNKVTLSENDGKYRVEAPSNATLNFSFMGMKTVDVYVAGRKVVNVRLEQDIETLADVVVTGYQTISKERATGSFAVITPKEIESKLQANVLDRIEGSVPGLNIITQGGTKSVRIRGVSTLNGNMNPLYVVDGVPFEGESTSSGVGVLDLLNPSDIANITVLKDATAASIYGARSANGVIVITTKSGEKGKTRVNYSNSISFQGLPDRDYQDRMTSSELVDYQLMTYASYPKLTRQTVRNFQNPVQILMLDHHDGKISDSELASSLEYYRTHDRYDQVVDEFLRNNKVSQQHNLSISGGSDIYKYSISFNYNGNAPYEKAQYSNRYGFNIKNSFDFYKWLKVDANVLGSIVSDDYDNGILGMSLLNTGGSSYYMLRDANGDPEAWYSSKSQYEIDRLIGLGLQNENYYPATELPEKHYTYKSNYLNLNLGALITITSDLKVSLRIQRETTNGFQKQFYTKNSNSVKAMINNAAQVSDGKTNYVIPVGGQIVKNDIDNFSYTVRGQVDYNHTFNKDHRLQVLAGAEARKVVTSNNGFYRLGYDDDNLSYSKINSLDLTSGIYGTQALYGSFWFSDLTPTTTYVDNRYESFYGNASYSYRDKLTVNGSIRIDQSNLFGTDPKYQYRPLWSAGAQYLVLNNYNWVDRFVVRATYGINGNIPKLNGPYLIANVGRNNSLTNEETMYISTPPNNSLRWEKTKVFNLGVDFNLLGQRLNGSVEFYNKSTSDLLGEYSLDPTLGWTSVNMNFGSMYNRGVEINLSSVNIDNGEWTWTTNATFSYNKNKITDIETSSESAYSYYYGLNNRVGYPMNALFSVRYKGLNEKGAPDRKSVV